jgi:tetratricopeptide (TPR) repeat protein
MTVDAPILLEGFRPVSDSLEWRIGNAYWNAQGNNAFLVNAVPHLITNDGMHAARAADVLFASCTAAARAGRLEDRIHVAELGAGVGLHAKLLLDRFRARCSESAADFYDRLTFYVTDRSRRMVTDIATAGSLQTHEAHVRFAIVDATRPGKFMDAGGEEEIRLQPLRAVLHNYLLDSLAFDMLLHGDGRFLRLHLQTRIDDTAAARSIMGTDLSELPALASSDSEDDTQRLLPLYDLFEPQPAYIPAELRQIPFGDHLPSYVAAVRDARPGQYVAGGYDVNFMHPHGAIASLLATLALLRTDGFILFNDYGGTGLEDIARQHQRYGGSRAVGLNFHLLEHVLGRTTPVRILTPDGDERAAIHSRLITSVALPEVDEVFHDELAQATFDALGELMQKARAARERGDMEAVRRAYTEICERFPENWYVLTEWADVATHVLSDPALGLELAAKAVAMNPSASPLVHTVYGDAAYRSGDREKARDAYLTALGIQPDDFRAHGSMAMIHADEGRFSDAISEVSLALAADLKGAYRPMLTAKLNEILDRRQAASRNVPS